MLTRAFRTDTADGVELREEFRRDRGTLRPMHRTPEGYLLAEGFFAKPGVLKYRNDDGTVTRELLLEEELHRPDSLGSLGRKPVTLEHPDEPVTPENVKELGVGDVGPDIVTTEGGFVRVELAIRRKDAIDAIDGGKLELSPGYRVMIEPTSGIHPVYGAYDAIQRDRRYNHLAVVDRARGGASVRLRADTAEQVSPFEPVEPVKPPTSPREDSMNPIFLSLLGLFAVTRADSKDMDDEGAAKRLEREIKDLQRRLDDDNDDAGDLDKIKADLKTAQDALGEMTKARDALAEELKKLKGEGKSDAEKHDARMIDFAARRRLEDLAVVHKVDGADKPKEIAKLTDADLRKAVVLAGSESARKDGDDDYYRVAVDMLGKPKSEKPHPLTLDGDGTRKDGDQPPTPRDDGASGWLASCNDAFDAARPGAR